MKRVLKVLCWVGMIMVPGLLMAQPPGRGRGGPGGGGPGGDRGPGGGPPSEMIMRLFDDADTDGDGSVTRDDLTAAMQKANANDRGRRPGGRQSGGDQAAGRGGPEDGRRRPEGGPRAGRGPGDRGPGDRGPRDDRGPRGERGPGGDHGPPPRPGQIMPHQVADMLGLNDQQTQQIRDLQSEVDDRLATILSAEQLEQVRNDRPPHPHDHGDAHQHGRERGPVGERGRRDRPE